MNRYLVSGVLVAAVMLFSCTTEPCGCTPAVSLLHVTGTVLGADQNPVEGAKVDFGQQRTGPCAPTADIEPEWASIYGSTMTATTGSFAADLFGSGNDEPCILVTAVAGNDTARAWRVARFTIEPEPPDTLHVTLTLGAD